MVPEIVKASKYTLPNSNYNKLLI